VAEAARGVATAVSRVGDGERIDAALCSGTLLQGSPPQIAAVLGAGLDCDEWMFGHVPEGSAIPYHSRPPIAGEHYPTPYPRYGVLEEPVLPGYWVHNLEDGAIVVLYNCPQTCPDLVAQVRRLYDGLPADPDSKDGRPRMLAIPYADMDTRLAAVAWGQILRLDALDDQEVRGFYARFIGRKPCTDRACVRE
jgi:hypothetical protein